MEDQRLNRRRPMRMRNPKKRQKAHDAARSSIKRDVTIDGRLGSKTR